MMRVMRISLAILVAGILLLGGCADGLKRRQAAMAPLVGQTETDLVRQLGVPTRTIEVGGHRFLAYDESWIDVIPGGPIVPLGGPWWGPGWGPIGVGGIPPSVVQWTCVTTFEIVEGRVISFTIRGNGCT